jgi:hypothetical protein
MSHERPLPPYAEATYPPDNTASLERMKQLINTHGIPLRLIDWQEVALVTPACPDAPRMLATFLTDDTSHYYVTLLASETTAWGEGEPAPIFALDRFLWEALTTAGKYRNGGDMPSLVQRPANEGHFICIYPSPDGTVRYNPHQIAEPAITPKIPPRRVDDLVFAVRSVANEPCFGSQQRR